MRGDGGPLAGVVKSDGAMSFSRFRARVEDVTAARGVDAVGLLGEWLAVLATDRAVWAVAAAMAALGPGEDVVEARERCRARLVTTAAVLVEVTIDLALVDVPAPVAALLRAWPEKVGAEVVAVWDGWASGERSGG